MYSIKSNVSFPMILISATSMGNEFIKYPNHFIDQSSMENLTNLKSVKFISEGQTLNGTFLEPLNIRGSVQSREGEQLAILESNRLSINLLGNILIIPLILCGSLLNFILASTTLRISCRQLPWVIYLFYIILLDQFDLMISAIDFLVESYHEIRLLVVLQFLGRFYCQILPMFYNLSKHIHSTLFILFIIESLKSYSNLLKQLNIPFKQTKEIVQNALIFILVVTITLNCQFIWTFDLSQLETLMLHERVVQNIYKCDFASTWILSPTFLNYIWPLLDHLCGDLLPCFICLFGGLIGYILYRFKVNLLLEKILNQNNEKLIFIMKDIQNNHKQDYNKEIQLSYIKWIAQIIRVFILFSFIHGVFLLPRCLYYLVKYSFFLTRLTSRNNVHIQEQDELGHIEQDSIQTISKFMDMLRPYEVYLESYEIALRYSNFIEVHIRAAILLLVYKNSK
ncbi:unnamed protein product [Heterobilharzia americana]|nr:unnamed protein product [Heterobilharzia americana]